MPKDSDYNENMPLEPTAGVKHHDGVNMEKHSTVGDLKEQHVSDRRDASTTCYAASDAKSAMPDEFVEVIPGVFYLRGVLDLDDSGSLPLGEIKHGQP